MPRIKPEGYIRKRCTDCKKKLVWVQPDDIKIESPRCYMCREAWVTAGYKRIFAGLAAEAERVAQYRREVKARWFSEKRTTEIELAMIEQVQCGPLRSVEYDPMTAFCGTENRRAVRGPVLQVRSRRRREELNDSEELDFKH